MGGVDNMKVYIVVKSSYVHNLEDEPNNELVEIDCVKATRDGALERIKELAVKGYRGADYREVWYS